MSYEYHPIANIFPMMSKDERTRLKASITDVGQLEPVLIYEGKILDGRNRYEVCQELGKTIREAVFDEDEMGMNAVQFVMATNLSRRSLKPSQASMAGAKLLSYYEDQAKERQAELGKSHGDDPSGKFTSRGRARDEAAKVVGVSGKSISDGKKVLNKGTKELQDAVDAGEIAVSKAAKIADLPPEDQNKVVSGEMKLPPSKPKQSASKPSEPPQAKPGKEQASGFGSLLQEAIDNGRLLPFSYEVLDALSNVVLESGNPDYATAFVDHLGLAYDKFEKKEDQDA